MGVQPLRQETSADRLPVLLQLPILHAALPAQSLDTSIHPSIHPSIGIIATYPLSNGAHTTNISSSSSSFTSYYNYFFSYIGKYFFFWKIMNIEGHLMHM